MSKLKGKIKGLIKEITADQIGGTIDNMKKVVKTELPAEDDKEVEDMVASFINPEGENEEGEINEKAKSKSQQRFMGMVSNCQDNGECPSKAVKDAAGGMSKSDVDDIASTKHKGLPNRVDEMSPEDKAELDGIVAHANQVKIKPRMSKNELHETVMNYSKPKRKVIKTIKIKDLKNE